MEKRCEKLCVALTKDEKKKLIKMSMHRGESYAVCVRDLIRMAYRQSEFSQHREKEVSHGEISG